MQDVVINKLDATAPNVTGPIHINLEGTTGF